MAEALGLNLGSFIGHAINFIILLFLLQRFLYKPVLKMLDERATRVRESMERAEEVRRQSAEAQAERSRLIDEARRESSEMVNRALAEAEQIRSEARRNAQEDAQRIITRAQQEATAERQQAEQELRAYVADLAILAAERIIGQSMDNSKSRQLVEQFLVQTDGRSGATS
jgi:F-type H+-transporting ATPase subunit b